VPPSTAKKKIRPGRKGTVKPKVSESVSSVPTDGAASDTHSPIRGNLPLALSRFIGRERELPVVRERLASARLLTLTGTGGCGKTRLALEIASGLVTEFADGVWYVELAPLTERKLVPYIVASTLGVREQSERPIIETLVDALHPRALLIVLDNCEHLLNECAQLCEALLQFCPGVRILATSREPLGAMGEIIWNVLPLALPDSDQALPDDLFQVESVQLFVEKVTALIPEFTLSRANAPYVAQICRRLDGLPLAIELAAARCRSLSVQELAVRLGERFELLTQGRRTAPLRQQTLQATIDWSYSLLDADERTVFQRLAVFAGGSTLAEAEAVCGTVSRAHFLDVISLLVDKSLVVKQERNGDVRYSMLETLRQYAWERLQEAGQEELVRNRHLAVFVELAEQAAPRLVSSEELAWLTRLQQEMDNLRAALAWSIESDVASGIRIAAALRQFSLYVWNLAEASEWVDRLIAASAGTAPTVRARGLVIAGTLAGLRGEGERAATLLDQSLSLYEQLGDEKGIAQALQGKGFVAHHHGDRRQAVELLAKSLKLIRRFGDKYEIGEGLLWLADTEMRIGDLDASQEHYEESYAIFLELGEQSRISWALGGQGDIAQVRGNHSDAARLLKEALQIRFGIQTTGDIFYTLEAMANLAARTHAPERAARIWGVSEALREVRGAPLPPSYQSDYAPLIRSVRGQLGAEAFETAWAEGRAMTLEQGVEYTLRDAEPQTQPTEAQNKDLSKLLTLREIEVLRLIVAGLSNREIAEQLVLTLGTIKWYTNEIYSKLGVRSRTQAVALANRLDLL
jgi:predicted ATPase/DNA-binding CsgD family transcriptional regulator